VSSSDETLVQTPAQDSAGDGDFDDEWLDEPPPAPPRRRWWLSPLTAALLALLVAAGAFFAGVEVEKSRAQPAASGGGGAAGGGGGAGRFARAGGGGTFAGGGASGGGISGGGAGGGGTLGTIKTIQGSSLYVTSFTGGIVKVKTTPATTFTKTQRLSVLGVNPGDFVVVQGTQNKDGSVTARSVSVGAAGGQGSTGGAANGG
jgi:hypothetical protein